MSNKFANTEYEVHPLIQQRWSPRAFAPDAIEPDKLRSVFEAARWSASGGNQQPWRFILGYRDDESYKKIFSTLADGNKEWAGLAPVLVLTIGKNTLNSIKRPNTSYRYDVGQSVAQLSLQATQLGLVVHQMSGFSPEQARGEFNIPEDYDALTVFALGYPGDPLLLTGVLRDREIATRERMRFDEFVFTGSFGTASGLFA